MHAPRSRRQRRLTLAGVAVVLGLVLGGAAAPAAAVSVADPPDFTPSRSSAKAWMLNVLGSVLGGSMPNSWRAEQLANQYRYNHSWETLNAQFGHNSANPNYMGSPDSYDDYVIRRHEQELRGNGNGRPLAAPATRTARLTKIVGGIGGAATAITGASLGIQVGNGIAEFFGLDVNGLVCTQGDAAALLSLVSGADCSAYDYPAEFIPNQDAPGGYGEVMVCWTRTSSPTSEVCMGVQMTPAVVSPPSCSAPPQGISYYYVRTVTGPTWNGQGYQPTPSELTGVRRINVRLVSPTYDQNTNVDTGVGVNPGYSCSFINSTFAVGMPTEIYLRGATNWSGWTPGAVPVEAPAQSTDPERFLTCTIVGDDGNTYTQQSAGYHETDDSIAAPECPVLPDGVRPESMSIDDSQGNELMSETVTPEYAAWWDAYPECRTGACKLDLITKANPTFPVSCFDVEEGCAGWFTDPDRATKYECHYGIHTVDLEECYVYSGIFEPGRVEIGAPYSDPMTGSWSGGTNAPSPDRQALGQTIQDPGVVRSCNGMQSAGFDPVAWVMRPIQCALEWAFVPRPARVELAGARLGDAFEERAPGQITAMVGAWSIDPSMDGCRITYTHWETDQLMTLVDACEGSVMAPLAQISRVVSTVAVAIMVVTLVRRQVAGTVDYRGN